MQSFAFILEIIGTVAFAISGAMAAWCLLCRFVL